MNKNHILTTVEENEEWDIPKYRFFKSEGDYVLRLVCRAWNKKSPGLVCCFETLDGSEFYRINAFIRRGSGLYCIGKCNLNFADNDEVQDNTVWQCHIEKNKKGFLACTAIEQLVD